MRIDLHLHSIESRHNGDSLKWLGNYEAIKRLKTHNIKIAAFTDHNTFNYKFYQELKILAKTADILILPGIELNVVRKNGLRANMIYIFSDSHSEKELKGLENITRKITKEGIALEKVLKIFSSFNSILIPHVGKSDFFNIRDLENIKVNAIEVSNFEHHNYKRFKKGGKDISEVCFSDTHFWNKYPSIEKYYTFIPNLEQSFKGLVKAFKLNKSYIKIKEENND